MGLLDKFKDLFTDVEEVEEEKVIEEEEITPPEENKLPTFMREKIEREEQEKVIPLEQPKEEKKEEEDGLLKPNNSFRFPIDYDDEDDAFLVRKETREEKVMRREVKHEEVPVKPKVELYNKSAKEKEKEKGKQEEKKFAPSPIISPVYGVLDKNYHQDEVRAKEEDSYELQRPSKKLDFESVRKKAFGTLSDDIKDNMMCENCELLKELKESTKVEQISEDDLLYEMTEEEKTVDVKPKDNITIDEAVENYYDFGVAYEPDTSTKTINDNDDVVIVNHNDEESRASKIEVKEDVTPLKDNDISLISDDIEEDKNEEIKDTPLEDLELTDDLFNLIDSMYMEKEDKND